MCVPSSASTSPFQDAQYPIFQLDSFERNRPPRPHDPGHVRPEESSLAVGTRCALRKAAPSRGVASAPAGQGGDKRYGDRLRGDCQEAGQARASAAIHGRTAVGPARVRRMRRWQGKPLIPTLPGASDSSPDGHRRPADRDSGGRPIPSGHIDSSRGAHCCPTADHRARPSRGAHRCANPNRPTGSSAITAPANRPGVGSQPRHASGP